MTAPGVVVHLVWAPLGTQPLERFVASYRRHAAGQPHRLLVAFNGFAGPAAVEGARAPLAGVDHEAFVVPAPRLDLAVYRLVVERVDAPWFAFLNSHSEALADGWLAALARHGLRDGVGIAGATGSFEGTAASTLDRLLRRRTIVPFPNPHVRTNAFLLRRDVALALDWGDPRSKGDAWQVENGPRGLTRQVLAGGAAAVVVGRDGEGYAPERWPHARVFRSGEQENLLVADNRTRDYARASPADRAALARAAWGPTRAASAG